MFVGGVKEAWTTYAWTDAGDDGDVFARHGIQMGDDGEEACGGVHKL